MENNMRQGKVTLELFNAVKICLATGNSITETARFMNMSKSVVGLIAKSETLEEYKQEMFIRSRKCHAKMNAKAKEAKAKEEQAAKEAKPETKPETKPEEVITEIKNTVTVQATKYMEDRIGEAVDLLKGISAKLAVIIDDLYGTKTP